MMDRDDDDWQENHGKSTAATRTTLPSSSHLHPSLPDNDTLEESIVGLCPAFWAHVPLTVRQVHQLKLWKGINCLLRCQNNDDDKPRMSVVPLSKCELLGLVVAAEQRGLGVVYVIDDGTGLIDCLHWQDDGNMLGLPSLTDEPESEFFAVGTLVRIFGRIEVIAVAVSPPLENQEKLDNRPHFVECIREIHASIVCDARQTDGRPSFGAESIECLHWRRCVEIPDQLLTSQDIIEKLGPDIAQQIARRESLPAADDSDGAWRVFGSRCSCNLPYKQYLLYCHCQATRESLDRDFRYRDALLKELIDLEKRQNEKEPLRFQYKTVKAMPALQDVLTAITQSVSAQESLVLSTFRSLRKDGVFYLIDEYSDTYLLISRGRVLEPYIETITSDDIERGPQRAKLRRQPPIFLQHVPKQRLQYVRRNFK